MLSSLKNLSIWDAYNLLPVGESHVVYQFPVESLYVGSHGCSAKELTRLLSCFPRLTKLELVLCSKLTGLGVLEQNAAAISTSSPSLDEKMDLAVNEQLQREVELELSTAEGGLVLLPPQLQELRIFQCQDLRLHSNREAGGWLQGQRSLRSLVVEDSDKFLSYYSSSSSPGGFPFPASLRNLVLFGVETPAQRLSQTSPPLRIYMSTDIAEVRELKNSACGLSSPKVALLSYHSGGHHPFSSSARTLRPPHGLMGNRGFHQNWGRLRRMMSGESLLCPSAASSLPPSPN